MDAGRGPRGPGGDQRPARRGRAAGADAGRCRQPATGAAPTGPEGGVSWETWTTRADSSVALLARLRDHVNGIRGGGGCCRCRPATGAYCEPVMPLVDAFYAARRAEVLMRRLAWLEAMR